MRVEDLVVSLETAKKLKEAGWDKETIFWWEEGYSITNNTTLNVYEYRITNTPIRNSARAAVVRPYDYELGELSRRALAAPTFQEIWDVLPQWIYCTGFKRRKDNHYLSLISEPVSDSIVYKPHSCEIVDGEFAYRANYISEIFSYTTSGYYSVGPNDASTNSAEAAAALWLWLKENNYIKLKA